MRRDPSGLTVGAGPAPRRPAGPTAAALEAFAFAPGFWAAATACELKRSGALDLALIASDRPASAAGVFTTNHVQAAPVILDREILDAAAGRIRAVIANSGCANACTGERGMRDAREMGALAARALGVAPEQVLVLSTGVIGVPLDMARLARGIAGLGTAARTAHADAARAIMTTDTHPKIAAADLALDGGTLAIRGIAKGAGMIHPHMATMLSVITTDARIEPRALGRALADAVEASFNRVSVDGDMSTNDTVLLLASGASGIEIDAKRLPVFTAALAAAAADLARQIARDGEGATRLVEIVVSGARDDREAHAAADKIACSPLVKTAIHGGDPNWGRILAAAGASAAKFDPGRTRLGLGAGARAVALVEGGAPLGFDAVAASALLRDDPVLIHLDMGAGAGAATVWTCDLSAEYVAINAEYTT